MKLSIGLKTDRGPREGQNQDSILGLLFEGSPQTALLVVADGMGGAKAGELASQEAVAVIHEYLVDRGLPTSSNAPERLLEAITAANAAIHQKSTNSPETEGMGCTVVVAFVIDDVYWIASVGDSRAYLMREQESYQITDDHTWVNARVKEGLLTPEQAASHSLRHVLDRALGTETTIEADIWSGDILEQGDVLLLCTDGLYGVLDDDTIRDVILGESAPEAANALVKQALSMPARDNVSVVVLRAD